MSIKQEIIDIKNELINDPANIAMEKGKPPVYEDLPVIHRPGWRARAPLTLHDPNERLKIPVMYIVLNHSGTETCTDQDSCEKAVREIQLRDMQERKLSDIQYNWVMGGDGNIYEGRGWHWRPPLNPEVPEHFDHSIEILFIGNYIDTPIPYAVSDPCFDLIQVLRARGVVHRFFKFERLVKFKQHKVDIDEARKELPP